MGRFLFSRSSKKEINGGQERFEGEFRHLGLGDLWTKSKGKGLLRRERRANG